MASRLQFPWAKITHAPNPETRRDFLVAMLKHQKHPKENATKTHDLLFDEVEFLFARHMELVAHDRVVHVFPPEGLSGVHVVMHRQQLESGVHQRDRRCKTNRAFETTHCSAGTSESCTAQCFVGKATQESSDATPVMFDSSSKRNFTARDRRGFPTRYLAGPSCRQATFPSPWQRAPRSATRRR